jgi:hypothetical protein
MYFYAKEALLINCEAKSMREENFASDDAGRFINLLGAYDVSESGVRR